MRQSLGQGVPVVQARQAVVPGMPRQLFAQVAGLGDIAKDQNTAHGDSVAFLNRGGRVFNGVVLSRPMD